MNLLFVGAGARVSFLERFRQAFKSEGIDGKIHTVDADRFAATQFVADKTFFTSRFQDPKFFPELMAIIGENKIDAIIPISHYCLMPLAENWEEVKSYGAKVIMSEPETVRTCCDKYKSFKFFEENDIPAVETWIDTPLLVQPPVFIKPRYGAGTRGELYKVNTQAELDVYAHRIGDYVLQEYLEGDEYTIDIFSEINGQYSICAIPRKRIIVKAGQAVESQVIDDDDLQFFGHEIASKLNAIGGMFAQCIKTKDGYKFFEMDARFGGSSILSIEAGANFPLWIIRLLQNKPIEDYNIKWGITMSKAPREFYFEN